ncbi:hypothetical protein QFZ73_001373 [Peribacillus sp. V2I11]|nr:hypothetical protein [Peribacillus sp. V2I11]
MDKKIPIKGMKDYQFVKGVLSKFYNKVDWSGCARLLLEKRVQWSPAGAKAPRADRPRKASAWRQRSICTNPYKTVDKPDFHRVCLQSGIISYYEKENGLSPIEYRKKAAFIISCLKSTTKDLPQLYFHKLIVERIQVPQLLQVVYRGSFL